jgi:hypothetical protein
MCVEAIGYFLTQLLAHLKIRYTLWQLLASVIFLVFIIYQTLLTLQHIFWFAAAIPNVWSLIFCVVFAATFLQYFRQPRRNNALLHPAKSVIRWLSQINQAIQHIVNL